MVQRACSVCGHRVWKAPDLGVPEWRHYSRRVEEYASGMSVRDDGRCWCGCDVKIKSVRCEEAVLNGRV
jgi:hypothetical protein